MANSSFYEQNLLKITDEKINQIERTYFDGTGRRPDWLPIVLSASHLLDTSNFELFVENELTYFPYVFEIIPENELELPWTDKERDRLRDLRLSANDRSSEEAPVNDNTLIHSRHETSNTHQESTMLCVTESSTNISSSDNTF